MEGKLFFFILKNGKTNLPAPPPPLPSDKHHTYKSHTCTTYRLRIMRDSLFHQKARSKIERNQKLLVFPETMAYDNHDYIKKTKDFIAWPFK